MKLTLNVSHKTLDSLKATDGVLDISWQKFTNFALSKMVSDVSVPLPPRILGRAAYNAANQQEEEEEQADADKDTSAQLSVDVSADNYALLKEEAAKQDTTPEQIAAEMLREFVSRLGESEEDEKRKAEAAKAGINVNARNADNDVPLPPKVLGTEAFRQNNEKYYREKQAREQD